MSLRVVLEAVDERFEFAVHGDERGDFYGGEQAVAGGAVVQKNDVAGLFAAENVAAAKHFFEDVAVADGGAGEGNAFAGENALEAEIGHGSGDDAIAFELVLGFQVTRGGEKNAVAVDDFPVSQTKRARSASPSKATPRRARSATMRFCKPSEMERTAAGVDVAAVG